MSRLKSNLTLILIIIITIIASFTFRKMKKIDYKISSIDKSLSSPSMIVNSQGTAIIKSYESIGRKNFLRLIDQNVKIL